MHITPASERGCFPVLQVLEHFRALPPPPNHTRAPVSMACNHAAPVRGVRKKIGPISQACDEHRVQSDRRSATDACTALYRASVHVSRATMRGTSRRVTYRGMMMCDSRRAVDVNDGCEVALGTKHPPTRYTRAVQPRPLTQLSYSCARALVALEACCLVTATQPPAQPKPCAFEPCMIMAPACLPGG